MSRHTPPPQPKQDRHYTRPRNIHTYLKHLGGRICDLAPEQLDRAAAETLRQSNQDSGRRR